ncbi:MAG: signal peptidase I [Euryarchaeota archaeon]|nr:signal peptidase I [Euryarchaeota archaeon]
MIINIITIMASAVILTAVTESILVNRDILGHPLYSYILWHIMLFAGLYMIFHESRHGFRNTIGFISRVLTFVKRNSKKNALDHTISRYRDRTKKVYLSTVMVSVALTLLLAFVLYSELIFFSVVVSDSMNPALKKGDLILMQNIYAKPDTGDIITVKVPDMRLPVMHRVVSISDSGLRTKGDANPTVDPWIVTKDRIRGENVLISGHPMIISNLGAYFIIDASGQGRMYGPEFDAVSKLIRGVKAAGLVIFFICIILYLAFSIRDARRIRL